jgi:hypothetical protein
MIKGPRILKEIGWNNLLLKKTKEKLIPITDKKLKI